METFSSKEIELIQITCLWNSLECSYRTWGKEEITLIKY